MPVFSYQGCDSAGTVETGMIEASEEKLAFEILQSRGITVFELALGEAEIALDLPWYRRDLKLFGPALSYESQAVTADLLSTLFGAGLPATDVARAAVISSENAEVKRHFERVEQRIADGASFADAFEAENRLFTDLFGAFLKVSDTANAMPHLLKELAEFLKVQHATRQKILSVLIYPAILTIAAIALLLVVVFYLAPNLAPIFASVGKEPPGTLAVLLFVNERLRAHWLTISVTLGGAVFAALMLFHLPGIKSRLTRLAFRLPLIGRLSLLNDLARLCQATSLLLMSGQPLASALRTSSQMVGSASGFGARFEEAASAIESGFPASSVFDEDHALPPIFKELFRIGEQTNQLRNTLSAVSDALSEQANRYTQRLLNLLTPLLTLILGLGVGLLIYTLMGAILEVNELAF